MADTPYPEPLPTLHDRVAKLFSREGPSVVARRIGRVTRRVRPSGSRVGDVESATAHPAQPDWVAREGIDTQEAVLRERRYVSVVRAPAAPVALLRCRHTMEHVCGGSPALGWERYVEDNWEVHEVPGSHDTMLGEPHVHALADTLSTCLRRAQEQFGG